LLFLIDSLKINLKDNITMKIFLMILISFSFFVNLVADEVVILKGENRDVSFKKGFREVNFINNNRKIKVYYDIFGRRYFSNNTIIVKFKKDINIVNFEKKYNLKYLRQNNTGSYVFQNIDNMDIIIKSNQIFKLNFVKSVSPNWIRKKQLL